MEAAAILPAAKLVPTLPSFNVKYQEPLERASVQTRTTVSAITRFARLYSARTPRRITSANVMGTSGFADEVPLPNDWVEYLHPEGNLYYYNHKAGIVSNTDLRRIGVSAVLNNAFERIQSQLLQDAKPDNLEVYLNIVDASRLGSDGAVEYYLIDYNSRSIFWVEDLDILTDLVGSGSLVEPFESMRHLRLGLEPEFWTHVEFHPCHQQTYDLKAEKELTAVLRHGCVDDMTAPGSVFPYSTDECLQFLKLLERFHGDDESTESYRRSWTARLWASICRSRRINRHGLAHPRIDRLQGLDSYLSQQTHRSVVMSLGEALCLGMPKTTFVQLTELWNGRIVYQRHWKPFLDRQRSKWRWTAFGALYLLGMNSVQRVCGTPFVYLLASTSFTCSALLVSALMLRAHSVERLKTASDLSSYISMVESFDHGLRPLSIAYTLPEALLAWAAFTSGGGAFYYVTSQLQDDPTQLLSIATSTAIPLFLGRRSRIALNPNSGLPDPVSRERSPTPIRHRHYMPETEEHRVLLSFQIHDSFLVYGLQHAPDRCLWITGGGNSSISHLKGFI
ncbi:hypothetical protein M407DRAFT_23499 [Tulasnella calospora MUT 4182]|uniref:WW domain-containing protein n=1 Tax=Tulasnella calospora MUT 4182 TaxID=1051891 RepID=A0A0C3QAM4_9AGAM|nr:hypothetical protein M407DRAFT_23499 [Tulasnella calospora MUT 4182]